MTQPDALRFAEALEIDPATAGWHDEAAAELRRLHADAEENEALRERLSGILKATAIALRGPEPELTNWGWHDLPERAAALVSQRDELLEVVHDAIATLHHIGYPTAASDLRAAVAKAEKK